MVLDYKANIMEERTSEANNKYMHGYGESNFIQYLDFNNQYGFSLS